MGWDSPLTAVTGKATTKVVKETGFATVGELLEHYPRHYVERGRLSDLGELTEGDYLSLVGQIVHCEQHSYQDRRTKRTAYRLEVRVKAEDGVLALTYFDRTKGSSDWHAKEYAVGRVGLFSGRLKWFNNHWELTNPDSRMYVEDGDVLDRMPALIPIYKAVGKLNTWQIEETVGFALDLLDEVPETLPDAVRAGEDLIGRAQALRWIHHPDDFSQLGAARKRLRYDEAFVTQTVLARRRSALRAIPASPRPGREDGILAAFDARLPFTLTAGQARVGEEIAAELAAAHPMHRLLQGEVGSGKTLVALRAMLQVVDAGGQAALLAPTEVLAQQHLRSIEGMLGDLGRGGLLGGAEHATRIALLTGSMGTAARRQAMLDAASGDAGIVIGTHALLEEKVQFFDLGLVVVDEQHRFGVEQRAALTSKAGNPPHVLVMTATPIPRTVAMTVFGDLDTSTLSELPAGRGDVQTTVVPVRAQPSWLERAWQRIREEVAGGHQAYVVCARIGDEPPAEEGPELHAVEELAPELAQGALQGLRVEMLHGRMTPDDKDRVMQAFAAGDVDVLVSTTVIEVGVDVPNATVMVILDAERFGVSQLHQLRGRIGRGGHHGLCLLVTGAAPDSPSLERLVAVASTRDGFELSRIDLEQRREGNVLGVEQSGRRSELRLLSVLNDEDVIVAAREAASAYLEQDPDLGATPGLRGAVLAIEESERADFLDKG
ncbi:ATP-dependent DNA helicase RecG [Nocardioides pocheonensis]|uniref:ATP-dependent DNA helicase RecG n=1 Tax=Nocardioides pocheonensis TaxID=661485 RepID=UPI001FEC50C6|nr:ATP-dependent DNA helicase RecG [Nocardioides pocheonensis]